MAIVPWGSLLASGPNRSDVTFLRGRPRPIDLLASSEERRRSWQWSASSEIRDWRFRARPLRFWDVPFPVTELLTGSLAAGNVSNLLKTRVLQLYTSLGTDSA